MTVWTEPHKAQDETAVKVCCSGLYESEWATWLLGESFHPGGLNLTARMGELLQLQSGHRLLDVASGRGTSALFLAQRFGCEVVGIDYSARQVSEANREAKKAGINGLVYFESADAEALPFSTNEFDAVLCECSFCTFPDKRRAAGEMARVLKPGGRLGLSDLTRNGPVPPDLRGLVAWISCIAGSQQLEEAIGFLEAANLKISAIEAHDKALAQLVHEVRGRLIGIDLLLKLRHTAIPGVNLQEAKAVARHAETAVAQGTFGYALVVARKATR